jgi:ribosome-binding protein aMBF1 (putative translation factor)
MMGRTRNFAKALRKEINHDPALRKAVDRELFNSAVAGQIYQARESVGWTQSELARRAGTHQSVIARMEDADYAGHSLSMLRRIAEALGKRIHIEFRNPDNGSKKLKAPVRRRTTRN